MPRRSYHERDYAFGQTMFRLRTSIGLTQIGLAKLLGVSRRALGEWEGGLTYPKAERLQHALELCVRTSVFAPEREEEEIRALWTMSTRLVNITGSSCCPAVYSAGPFALAMGTALRRVPGTESLLPFLKLPPLTVAA